MNDITALMQRLVLAAAKGCCQTLLPDDCRTLVEALEKAQGMEDYWKTQCRGIADHSEKLQAQIEQWEKLNAQFCSNADADISALRQRIIDLESRTVTVKLRDINEYLAEVRDKTLRRALLLTAEGVRAGDIAAMTAAGIQVIEGEGQ